MRLRAYMVRLGSEHHPLRNQLARAFLYLMVVCTVFGCGNSAGEEYVYTGAAQGDAPKNSGANQVLLSVTVPGNVTGAQPLNATQGGVTVKAVVAKADPITAATGDYTLPGALCRAYDILGQPVSTVVVNPEGAVRFDTLPSGLYRFVVTNQDQAVLLEVIASASPSGPTLIDANTSSTAAVLVALAAGKGSFDLKTYSHALAADLSQLIALVEAQVANPSDPWVTSDGKTVTDPVVRQAVDDAVHALPGKGKYVRGDQTPDGYGQATPAPAAQSSTGVPAAPSEPSQGTDRAGQVEALPGEASSDLTSTQDATQPAAEAVEGQTPEQPSAQPEITQPGQIPVERAELAEPSEAARADSSAAP